MAVNTTGIKTARAACNGSVTEFTFDFKIFEDSDLKVYKITTADDTRELLTLTADYTVSATNDDFSEGGTVTTVQTYASGYEILIVRDVENLQETDYVHGDDLPSEVLENDLDRRCMKTQELVEKLSRALVFPIEDPTTLSSELPLQTDRAGKSLLFGANGEPIAGSVSSAPVSSFMETVVDDVSAEAGRTTLGIDKELELTIQDGATKGEIVSFDGSNYKVGVHYQDFLKYAWRAQHPGGATVDSLNGGACLLESGWAWQVYSGTGASGKQMVVGHYEGKGATIIDYGQKMFTANDVRYPSIAVLDPTNKKVVVVFKDTTDTNHGTAFIGQMSDSKVISWGSEAEFDTNTCDFMDVCVLDSTHFVVVWHDTTGSLVECRCGSVSGTTITWGAAVTFKSAASGECRITALSDSKFAIMWTTTGGVTEARIGTVSGTTITAGASAYTVKAANGDEGGIIALDSTTIIIFYEDSSATSGCAKLGTVSGDVITFESEVTFSTDSIEVPRACKIDADHFILCWSGSTEQLFVMGKRSTTTLTFGTAIGWAYKTGGAAAHVMPVVDGFGWVMLCHNYDYDATLSIWGMGMFLEGEKIGIAVETIGAASSGTVQIRGKVTGLSDLVAGQKYYRGPNGQLVTTGHEKELMGVGLSTTELLLY